MNDQFKHIPILFKKLLDLLPFNSMPLYKCNPLDKPYKTSFHKQKAIFIHIPKCAGMSVSEALFDEQVGHHFLWEFQARDEKKFKDYFKFSFVRNPWDRLLSAFIFLQKGGINPLDQKWAKTYLEGIDDFEAFVLALREPAYSNDVMRSLHFYPQRKFLENWKGELEIDFLGRFESIEQDFEVIKEKLNSSIQLPIKNISKHKSYTAYYTPKMIAIVHDLYKEDIETFDYYFDE